MESEYVAQLAKEFKKNVSDSCCNFIILDSINEKISDYEEMRSFAESKDFKVYICELEVDLQTCINQNIHKRSEDDINRIIDYFEPTPSHHNKIDVSSLLQNEKLKEVNVSRI